MKNVNMSLKETLFPATFHKSHSKIYMLFDHIAKPRTSMRPLYVLDCEADCQKSWFKNRISVRDEQPKIRLAIQPCLFSACLLLFTIQHTHLRDQIITKKLHDYIPCLGRYFLDKLLRAWNRCETQKPIL
jgi:hypothetical protein